MDKEERADLARRIRAARKERSWSQRELATRAQVSLGMIGNLELGKSVPQQGNLVRIMSELGLTGDAGECCLTGSTARYH